MKTYFSNLGYFLREAKDIFLLNRVSNFFSLLSTSLIFFVLALVIAGWNISSGAVTAIQGEAEISIYTNAEINEGDRDILIAEIRKLVGVTNVTYVDPFDAYKRMEKVLGEDARVLSYFDDNPFEGFLEVSIDLAYIDDTIEATRLIEGVEAVRDNKDVLDRLSQLSKVLNILSYLIVAAVGITTLVIMSHITRQGVYHHREQIVTLELLGAPKSFISMPFIIEGVLMTLTGGILALILSTTVIQMLYAQISGPLPFIPLPHMESVIGLLVKIVLALCLVLGFLGSVLGIKASRAAKS